MAGPAQNACSRAVELKLIFTSYDYFHINLKYGAKFIQGLGVRGWKLGLSASVLAQPMTPL